MNLQFANGLIIAYESAIETEEYINGSNRRTITFDCKPKAISVDEINTILSSKDNTQTLKIVNEKNETLSVYDEYTIKISCGISNILV